ncbi:MAG: alpha/beta fold hydrolase, partial [Brachybacterium sp.]|nr:alpha/beta fold hydrolase [Brachybacterium sp.]
MADQREVPTGALAEGGRVPEGGALPEAAPLPEVAPLLEDGFLEVGDGHRVLYEVSGAETGIWSLYLHGGPGGRLRSGYRRNAPAELFRNVGFSQRGAGRSTPSAATAAHDLATNTTAHLIADIERLRSHLGVESWVVQGVSWGTHLALAYAQARPTRVRGIVLMAVAITDRKYVDWITEGVGAVYPEGWDAFAVFAEEHGGFDRADRSTNRMRLVEAYRDMLASDDEELVDAAAREWMAWEAEHIRIG